MHTNINIFRRKKFCCEAHKFTRERPQRLRRVRHTSKEVADMAEEAKALGYKLEPTESVKTRLEDKARELGFHLVPRSAHYKTGKMQILATKPIGGGNLEVSFSFSVFLSYPPYSLSMLAARSSKLCSSHDNVTDG